MPAIRRLAPPTHRALPFLVAIVIALAGLAQVAEADWPTDGTSGLPICTNTANQEYPDICSDGVGGAYIAWYDARPNGGIFGQRVNALGQQLWTADGIKLASTVQSHRVSICPDGSGGLFVLYASANNLHAQRVDAAGNALWGAGVVVCNATGTQSYGKVFPDGSGGALFGWYDGRGGTFSTRLFAQRAAADGTRMWAENGVPADLTPQNLTDWTVAPDGSGGILLSWSLGTSTTIQRIDGGGNRMWGDEGNLVGSSTIWLHHPSVAPDGAGGGIVTWWDARNGPSDLYAKRYDAAGSSLWPHAPGAPVVAAPGEQRWSSMIGDGAGGAIVAWLDFRPSGSSCFVYAQRLDPSGSPLWTLDGVALTVTPSLNHAYAPIQLAPDGLGGAVMTWLDYRVASTQADIRAARVGPGGTSPWGNDGIGLCSDAGLQLAPVVTGDGYGGALVAWSDYRSGSQSDIYAGRVDASGVIGPPVATAALVSLVRSDVAPDRIRLTWHSTESAGLRATLERRTTGTPWQALAGLASDGSGSISYEDRDVLPGGRYGYRLVITHGGDSWTTPESWFDVAGALAFGLEGARPVPSSGPAAIWFTLPDASPATLELFDVTGRVIARRGVGELGPGLHAVSLDAAPELSPGVYLVRLTRGPDVRTARMVIAGR